MNILARSLQLPPFPLELWEKTNPVSTAAGNSRVESCNLAHFLSASVLIDVLVYS